MLFSSKRGEPLSLYPFLSISLLTLAGDDVCGINQSFEALQGFPRRLRRRRRTRRTALIILPCCECCGRIAASSSPNKPDRRFWPPTRWQRYRSSSLVCFPVLSCTNFPSDTILLDVYARFLSLSLSSLVRGEKEDYHSTTSGRQTTRLLNRGKRRMTVATDPVAASLATVCLLPSSITAAAADSRRQ